MYQVIEIYGDNEPWWFFNDWQKDITLKKEFSDFLAAKTFFEAETKELHHDYLHEKGSEPFLRAFWNDNELRWCEECDDDLQQYKGLMLLKNFAKVTSEGAILAPHTASQHGRGCPCKKAE